MRGAGAWAKLLLLGLVPLLFLEGIRLMVDAPFTFGGLVARWGFVTGVLVAAALTRPYSPKGTYWRWPGWFWLASGAVAGLAYGRTGATCVAWFLVGTVYVLMLGLETVLTGGRSRPRRWAWRGLLALTAGALPVALLQLESHFADEEFFVVLEALVLAILWLLLLIPYRFSIHHLMFPVRWGIQIDRRVIGLVFCLLTFGGMNGTMWAYRHSFYPPVALTYPGISEQSPFLCSQALPDPQVYDGRDVFRRILARVEANPHKGPPEYGVLALGMGERRWAEAFRDSLLQEVAEGRYTGPAHSVKSVQFEAALRAYYYPCVRERFPDLFSEEEDRAVRAWFAAINRRALTVEWVDLMYALAFSKWPEGPYENQENGAGLLALLEAEGLAHPKLSSANRNYLARNRRGWEVRFRVTDDAIVYQPEWIYNAYFQSLYTGKAPGPNARLSFEWLVLQALPDGAPLKYNHPGRSSPAGIIYLGAKLFGDPRYIWLAGRAVEALEQRGGYLFAQPGVEEPVLLEGRSLDEGSCLLYGDSGLPNQKGPLAPDKIVFRDGWGPDAMYLLVNLRFTGWHRYKATGTVSLVYQNGPLAGEVLDGQPFAWLPKGRSLFRDKRVPRENLNGLVVAKRGTAAVLYTLTGVGGPWAQDPPYYAEVVDFETSEEVDWAHIRLTGWQGWQQDRQIYFHRNGGPIVIVDIAGGPVGTGAALFWHFAGEEAVEEHRFLLRTGSDPVEAVVLPWGSDGQFVVEKRDRSGNTGLDVVYYENSHLALATLFLRGEWVGAGVIWEAGGTSLRIEHPDRGTGIVVRVGGL